MAVEAQYHLNHPSAINVFKDHHQHLGFQNTTHLPQQQQFLNIKPELNLTPSAGSRKRGRDDDDGLIIIQQQQQQQQQQQRQPHLEIDALVRLHNEKLRSGVDEMQKRHCRQILTIMEHQAATRLFAKETEIENAKQRQNELEVRLRQLTAENRIWFTVAKNSEAVAYGLKARLDQVLSGPAEPHVAAAVQAEDAESCCFDQGSRGGGGERRRLCRVCGEKDVSVLLLPCRHLCVCEDCDSGTETCPVCSGVKNVGLQVFME